jgi:hypothetical protein
VSLTISKSQKKFQVLFSQEEKLMKTTSMNAKTEKVVSVKGALKTALLMLTIGLCAGIAVGPYLPPGAAQWAFDFLKVLVTAVIEHWVVKMIA